MTGRVKFYAKDKGFGFIVRDDGKGDVYFSGRSLAMNATLPGDGDRVEFEVRSGNRGEFASGLRVISSDDGDDQNAEGSFDELD